MDPQANMGSLIGSMGFLSTLVYRKNVNNFSTLDPLNPRFHNMIFISQRVYNTLYPYRTLLIRVPVEPSNNPAHRTTRTGLLCRMLLGMSSLCILQKGFGRVQRLGLKV